MRSEAGRSWDLNQQQLLPVSSKMNEPAAAASSNMQRVVKCINQQLLPVVIYRVVKCMNQQLLRVQQDLGP
jgi:hypothetical protein